MHQGGGKHGHDEYRGSDQLRAVVRLGSPAPEIVELRGQLPQFGQVRIQLDDFVERRRGHLQLSSLERRPGGIQPAVDAAALGALFELRVAVDGGCRRGGL